MQENFWTASEARMIGHSGVSAVAAATGGFRTFRIMEIALYHTLDKLPEAPATHILLTNHFKNAGREWRPKGSPEQVNVHDFIDPKLKRAVPYGVL